MFHRLSFFVISVTLFLPDSAAAQVRDHQVPAARPSDVATPEAIVLATYDAINREPGAPYQWDRFRSLFLPRAQLIPNVQQTGGGFTPMSTDEFIAWIDEAAPAGVEGDQGFAEEEISHRIERYGVIAHVFSTYQKHFWGSNEILGRGINTFQLVENGGRWWIAGIAWDEEPGAGPIPERYLPR
jgi:hypothetical protein